MFLPGKFHGQRGLVGYSPWGREKLDTTEQLHFRFSLSCIGEGNGSHSSVLAWRIPGTGEPGGLPSMGSQSRTWLKRLSSSRQHFKKQTLLCQQRFFKAMVFPIVVYGCESWTIKKAEHRRIDAFELCVGEVSWESLGLQGDPTSPS